MLEFPPRLYMFILHTNNVVEISALVQAGSLFAGKERLAPFRFNDLPRIKPEFSQIGCKTVLQRRKERRICILADNLDHTHSVQR